SRRTARTPRAPSGRAGCRTETSTRCSSATPVARTFAPDRVDRFYRAVRGVARFWLWFLFKSVDARHPERVPAGGPILLCVNHPNNFIDSLVVGAAMRRKVHYLATARSEEHTSELQSPDH